MSAEQITDTHPVMSELTTVPVDSSPKPPTPTPTTTPPTPAVSLVQAPVQAPEPTEEVGLLGKVNKTLNQATPLDAKGFQTNLFGCFDSGIKYLLYSMICPCCVTANTHTILENRECTIFDCLCTPNAYQTRQSIRQKYNLPTDTGIDCIGTTLCYCCTVHQNVRELERLAGGSMWANTEESRQQVSSPIQQNMD
jgi:Cys-rich protein (TIGR01571 family)